MKTDYQKVERKTEWLEVLEETFPYVENILRNPNRFIMNEEEIVKIEMARRITVDSIKHLSKNTNLIQEINEETGDVTPSKILNINKEENFNTYENRVIYTLIQNARYFIQKKKDEILKGESLDEKNDKFLEYRGVAKTQSEDININISLNTVLNKGASKKPNSELSKLLLRIKKMEERIRDTTGLETYKFLDKLHVALIRPPVRKTNLILKNVNFQYVMKLWDFLQEHLDDEDIKRINDKKDYMDQDYLKKLLDESFWLNYLIIRTLDPEYGDIIKTEETKKIRAEITDSLLEQILTLNDDLTKEQLEEMIKNKYTVIKYKSLSSIGEIQKIFKKHIDEYLEQIS